MEQNLDFELILLLLDNESHVRALAFELGSNHMTVNRRLTDLVDNNVLDFRVEGRNKVFFLKKSIEARSYVFMAELHKLNRTLISYPELRRVVSRIQKDPKIRLGILFGSHAKGTARKDSDIDIYIETKERKLKKELERTNSRLSVKIGEYDPSNLLVREIEKDHVMIKGVELFYEKKGSFDQIV